MTATSDKGIEKGCCTKQGNFVQHLSLHDSGIGEKKNAAQKRTLVEQTEESVRPAPGGFLPFKRSAFEIRRYLGERARDRLRN